MNYTGKAPSDTFNVGFKPKQNIPESRKNLAWCIQNIDWNIAMSPVWVRTQLSNFYDTFNGIRNQEKFKHLTQTYGVSYPVDKIKNIPLVRPFLSRLQSDLEERPFDFLVHSEDTESMTEKTEEISQKLLDQVVQVIMSGEDVEKQLDLLEKYYKQEFKNETEIGSHHFLQHYIQKHRLDRKLSEMFQDKQISGHEYYRTQVHRLGEDPQFEVIKPGNIFFSDNNVKWVSECDWAVHNTEMTPTEILDSWGDKMSSNDIKKIEDWLHMYHKDSFFRITKESQIDELIEGPVTSNDFRGNSSVNHKLGVYITEWKSIRKEYIMKSRNKYEASAPFIHPISYEELRVLPKSRKQSVHVKYMQDLYQGVRIADDIYVDVGKVKYPIRSLTSPSKVHLTFDGPTFNGLIKPYSLIAETEDLQDLYNNLHFHKENLIALSGVKGAIMDVAQLPDFGVGGSDPTQAFVENMKRWMYYKKMGVLFIDSTKEGLDGKKSSYNQFGNYDDTLGAGLEVILRIIQHVEDVAGRICGVPRQSLGDVKTYEGKGSTQTAINQGSLVVEYLFNEHDEVVQRALTNLINAAKIAYKGGMNGHYITDNKSREIFTLSAGWENADLGVYVTNKSSDRRSIDELKGMTGKLMNDGLIQFEDIIPLFKKNSLADVIRQIETNMSRRRIEMEQQNNKMQEMQAQLEMAKGQAEVDNLRAQVAKIQADIAVNQSKLLLEKQALEEETMIDAENLKLEQKRIDLEAKQLDVAPKQGNAAEVRNK